MKQKQMCSKPNWQIGKTVFKYSLKTNVPLGLLCRLHIYLHIFEGLLK